jgi:4-hydroxybenzoyl-CoA reductase subunit beta
MMLPFPRFDWERPSDVDAAVRALAQPGAMPVAGGTDLLPSVKHRLFAPSTLVSLSRLAELRDVSVTPDGGLSLGAAVTLREVSRLPLVRARWGALAAACATVGTPTIQAMGTLGGNLLLDTRCLYYNQPEGWRTSIGYCLKKDGTVCHVAPKGRGCYAVHSADTVPPLWLYGASVELAGPNGRRVLPVAELYRDDGAAPLAVVRGEVLTRVMLPPHPETVVARKSRSRAAIDYGWLLVAARRDPEGWRAVVSAVGSRPVEVAAGDPEGLVEAAFKAALPLGTHVLPAHYRRKMVRVEVRRALASLTG